MECKSLRDSGQEISQFGITFFAASVDDAETNKKFAESLDANYPILSDPEKKVAAAFGVLNDSGQYARRWTFYIDKEGIIRFVDRDVNPSNAGTAIVEKLKELGLTE